MTSRRLHLGFFIVAMIAWTVALLSPVPVKSAERALGGEFWVFVFGKGLHVGCYAVLTLIGGTIGRRWLWVFPLMLAHGAATELIQPHVGRTGSFRDWGLDALGVAIGGVTAYGLRVLRRRRRTAADSNLP